MEAAVFVVEQAGCASCARLVREAISQVAPVASVDVNADRDEATVTLAPGRVPSEDDLNRLLVDASDGSGHSYRVRPGSVRPQRKEGES